MENEVDYMRQQENSAYGEWLIKVIADDIGCPPKPEVIDRAVYKGTDCGAWVRFDEQGIMVGSIVEGSDAEFYERIELTDIDEDEDGKILVSRFWDAIERINKLACDAWDEANGDDED